MIDVTKVETTFGLRYTSRCISNASSTQSENGYRANCNVHTNLLADHSRALVVNRGRDGDLHSGSAEVNFADRAELRAAGNHRASGAQQRDFRPHHSWPCEGESLRRILRWEVSEAYLHTKGELDRFLKLARVFCIWASAPLNPSELYSACGWRERHLRCSLSHACVNKNEADKNS